MITQREFDGIVKSAIKKLSGAADNLSTAMKLAKDLNDFTGREIDDLDYVVREWEEEPIALNIIEGFIDFLNSELLEERVGDSARRSPMARRVRDGRMYRRRVRDGRWQANEEFKAQKDKIVRLLGVATSAVYETFDMLVELDEETNRDTSLHAALLGPFTSINLEYAADHIYAGFFNDIETGY